MSYRREQRVTRASNLTLSLWDREGTNFIGAVDGVTWFEDVTEIRGRSDDPWQPSSCHTQLAAPLTVELQRLAFSSAAMKGFCVSFEADGENYSGPVIIMRSSNAGVHLSVQGGLEQERLVRP